MDAVERYGQPPTEETLEALEHRIRAGLGPEAGLVDALKDGLCMERFLDTEVGRALVRDVCTRATGMLVEMTSNVANLTPDKAFQQQVALSQELGILRRIAAFVTGGRLAADRMVEQEVELSAHGGTLE